MTRTRISPRHAWDEYAEWHLGLTEGATDETKARYAFVFGDFRRIHRSGIIACHFRAAEWRHKEVELAAHELLQLIDRRERPDLARGARRRRRPHAVRRPGPAAARRGRRSAAGGASAHRVEPAPRAGARGRAPAPRRRPLPMSGRRAGCACPASCGPPAQEPTQEPHRHSEPKRPPIDVERQHETYLPDRSGFSDDCRRRTNWRPSVDDRQELARGAGCVPRRSSRRTGRADPRRSRP